MQDGKTWAILIGVWATFALDVYGSLNSSPQTTEINATARADSLMKWVYIADVVALSGGAIGSYLGKSAIPVIATGGVVLGMHLLYTHAKRAGLSSDAPGTESY